jgi:HD superfamily phosphohydrolase
MEKRRVFRDPVHGLISLDGEDAGLARVLDTRAFQRLRRIRQMGFASLVYPGAEHTRFGHALGAYHVARRVTGALEFEPEIARDVRVAALAHDLGHGPYSHAWEGAFGGESHEDWGARILREDDELREALGPLAAPLERFFSSSYRPAYARKLVSSQLDVDRMDYLLRDAHFTGVGYSAYDLEWIVHALCVMEVRGGDDPFDLVVDHRRGVHAVEQYLFGRHYMYAQVYYHKTVRAAEHMFLQAMGRYAELARAGRAPAGLGPAERLARGETISVGEYLWLDDARVGCALADWEASEDRVLADLSARIVRRRLFKTIDLGDDFALAERVEPALAAAARDVFGDAARWYWSIDRAERLHYAPEPGEEILVVGHPRGGFVQLGELVGSRPAFTVRVVAAPELVPAFLGLVKP